MSALFMTLPWNPRRDDSTVSDKAGLRYPQCGAPRASQISLLPGPHRSPTKRVQRLSQASSTFQFNRLHVFFHTSIFRRSPRLWQYFANSASWPKYSLLLYPLHANYIVDTSSSKLAPCIKMLLGRVHFPDTYPGHTALSSYCTHGFEHLLLLTFALRKGHRAVYPHPRIHIVGLLLTTYRHIPSFPRVLAL